MLPNAGWDLDDTEDPELLPPRDRRRNPLSAKCALFSDPTIIHTLDYVQATGLMVVKDELGVVYFAYEDFTVVSLDLVMDQTDKPCLIWETRLGKVFILWYNYNTSSYQTVNFDGENPCGCVDNIRSNPPEDSDIVLFYQINNIIYYRLQRANFSVATQVSDPRTNLILYTCGMTVDGRLALKLETIDAILLCVGETPVRIGEDYVGLNSGEIPWATYSSSTAT